MDKILGDIFRGGKTNDFFFNGNVFSIGCN